MGKSKAEKKIFVLDTSVILYDHNAVKHFEDNDVAIPIHVLEEIDNFKKGNNTKNFEARSFIRFIDELSKNQLLNDWIPLNKPATGSLKVVLADALNGVDAVGIFGDEKFDHKILNTALSLQNKHKEKRIILVSKDICLRLKAKSLNLFAEDYETGKIKNVNDLYNGVTEITNVSSSVIDEIYAKHTIAHKKAKIGEQPINHFLILKNGKKSALTTYEKEGLVLVDKTSACGVKARNAEQTFALHALLNSKTKVVTLQGMAGTGKTLIALAAALEQRKLYRQIYLTRPIIPLSNKDMGFLPGDISAKLDPFMEPLWDNLKYIKDQFENKDKRQQKTIDAMLESEKIAIAPLAYIRGRSLSRVFFIVDEAQNLTPHEVKTIISRAGDETKIVFTGDINQIDTPYLDAESNGLSYLIDRLKNNEIYAHVTLEKGERSELASLANELL